MEIKELDEETRQELIKILEKYLQRMQCCKPIDYLEIRKSIEKDYGRKYKFVLKPRIRAYTYVGGREIYFNKSDWERPNAHDIFDLLHEIGHLETNSNKMSRAEMEYLATMWAIEKSKHYGLSVGSITIDRYQTYINGFLKKNEIYSNRYVLEKEKSMS